MKVLTINKPGELRVFDTEKPVPGPGEVLAKVKHCGICGTDASIFRGTLNLGKGSEPVYPVRIGHEWSGVVEQIGTMVTQYAPGDRVVGDTGYSCGVCKYCLAGEYQCCPSGRAVGTVGNCWPGAFAEYMLMPERLVFKVPDNVSLEEAAMVEPASIGLYGLLRAPIGPAVNLLVLGTGAISLGGMACSKGMGTGKIILAGRQDSKLEIGRRMGADITVNMKKENLYDVVMRETDGQGMDVVLDATGAVELFNEAVRMLRPSGYLVIPGFYEQELDGVAIDNLVARNCTLVGAAGTTNVPPKVLDLISGGRVSLMPMMTNRFPFDKIHQAFAAVEEQKNTRVKIMVDF